LKAKADCATIKDSPSAAASTWNMLSIDACDMA
jgi:hypothetical protein